MPKKLNLDEKEVIKLYNKLESCPKVAMIFGCSVIPIKRILKENNVNLKIGLGLNEIEVIKLYKKYKNAVRVGKLLNCGFTTIYRILRKNRISSFSNKIELDKKLVMNSYKKLRNIKKVSENFDCSTNTIFKVLKNNKEEYRKLLRYKTNINEEVIIELYKKNKSIYKIGKEMNINYNRIYNVLKNNNIKMMGNKNRIPHNRLKLNEKKIINLYKNGVSPYKIANRFNCYPAVIYRILKRNNIKIPKNYLKGKTYKEYFGEDKSKKLKERIGNASKERWRDKNFARKVIMSLNQKPSSYEDKISELCIKYNLPFIYTGDGTFLIGHKNPDFINKEKRIAIEVFSDYYKIREYGSVKNYIKQREEYFAKYGYETIFITQNEILNENWERLCLNKIKESLKNEQ